MTRQRRILILPSFWNLEAQQGRPQSSESSRASQENRNPEVSLARFEDLRCCNFTFDFVECQSARWYTCTHCSLRPIHHWRIWLVLVLFSTYLWYLFYCVSFWGVIRQKSSRNTPTSSDYLQPSSGKIVWKKYAYFHVWIFLFQFFIWPACSRIQTIRNRRYFGLFYRRSRHCLKKIPRQSANKNKISDTFTNSRSHKIKARAFRLFSDEICRRRLRMVWVQISKVHHDPTVNAHMNISFDYI